MKLPEKKDPPVVPTPDPKETLKILDIPVRGSIGDDDEKLGFKKKEEKKPKP